MNYNEITIYCDSLEPIIGILYSLDVSGLVIKDKNDFEELLAHKSTAWDYIDDDLIKKETTERSYIQFYLSLDQEGDQKFEEIQKALALYKKDTKDASLVIKTALFREEDWANNWKQYFKPYEIGEHIVIKPDWETYDNRENRLVIEIDPGSAFGTGTHETTKMCIEALDHYITSQHKTLLDVGTGSGILSMAGIKLGMQHATAIDIDENAVHVAKENIAKSHMEQQITVKHGDLVTDISGTYDIIVANIIADAIIALCASITKFMTKDTLFISSGIINTKESEVLAAFQKCHLQIIERKSDGDWLCFVCKKQ